MSREYTVNKGDIVIESEGTRNETLDGTITKHTRRGDDGDGAGQN